MLMNYNFIVLIVIQVKVKEIVSNCENITPYLRT
jgi:hypothetical protein